MTAAYPLETSQRQTDILVGDGVTTAFGPFDFKIFETTDVDVWLKPDGAETFEIEGAGLSIAKLDPTKPWDLFTLTFVDPPPPTTQFLVAGNWYVSRSTGITKANTLDTTAVDRELTRIGIALQEINREIGRRPRVEPGLAVPRIVQSIIQDRLLLGGAGDTIIQGPTMGEATALAGRLDEALAAAEAAIAAAASVDAANNIVPDVATLKTISTGNKRSIVGAPGNERLFLWMLGNFVEQVATDTDGMRYVKANAVSAAIGAWVCVAPAHAAAMETRLFEFAKYRSWNTSDQDALEKLLRDAYDYAAVGDTITGISLNGCMVDMEAPPDIAALSGQSNNPGLIVFGNGGLRARPSSDWTPADVTKTISWTKNSDLISMASTAGLEVGMYLDTGELMANGICRYSLIKEIVDGTTVRMNVDNWKDGGGALHFKRPRYMLDFSGMNASNKRIQNLNVHCGGLASFCLLPSTGQNWTFSSLVAKEVRDNFITDWDDCAGGLVVESTEARPYDTDPTTRSAIGLLLTGGDSKLRNNRIIGFEHSQVMHGSGYQISGCHNFQGASGADAVRSSAFLHTKPAAFVTYTGNYVDNGGIEFTSENQPSYPPEGFRSIGVSGNIFTFNDTAQPGSFAIEFTPCVDGAALENFSNVMIETNVFRKLGDNLANPVNLRNTHGDLDKASVSRFSMETNAFIGFDQAPSSRAMATMTVDTGDITNDWNFGDFTDVLPFDLAVRRVRSVVPGDIDGLFNASDVLITPSFVTRVVTSELRVHLSAAAYGKITVQVDCSL